MKKIYLLKAAVLFFFYSQAQSITGNWEGAMNANGAEITIVFHIAKDSTGKLKGTFDSPRQMAYGLKCSRVIENGDSVLLEMKGFGAKYAGLLAADKKNIAGNWSQGGMSLPLDLKKTSDEATIKEMKRPQTPKPPFMYASEEVSYNNADKSITFGGTYTYPSGKVENGVPAVILITGSGQQDRDETLFEHKPFAVMADYLTKQGIAVLRVDDREKGKTTGKFMQSTTFDFAKDVEAGIEYLKTRKEVDVNNIGLIGHSEGGMIAPMVASKRKDVKFIVLLAGPGVPIIDLMEQQNMDFAASAGLSKEEIEQYRPLYRNITRAITGEADTAQAAKKAAEVFIKWQETTATELVKKSTNVTSSQSRDKFISAFVKQLNQPWYKYFIQFKPAEYLSKVKCAVLALNGEKDIQVAAKPNLEAIQHIMVEKMVKSFKVQEMKGLNHLFQHCKTCTAMEYAELEETFAPEALQLIGDWVKDITKK